METPSPEPIKKPEADMRRMQLIFGGSIIVLALILMVLAPMVIRNNDLGGSEAGDSQAPMPVQKGARVEQQQPAANAPAEAVASSTTVIVTSTTTATTTTVSP